MIMPMEKITKSAEETFLFAEQLGKQAVQGQIYALDGDLGTGKTVFCQGFAAGLEVTELVNSPTFTIVQEYTSGRIPLYHFDVYRIEEPEELEEIGYEEYFFGEGICLIEWAGRIRELMTDQTIRVQISKIPEQGPDVRRIVIAGLPQEQEQSLQEKTS